MCSHPQTALYGRTDAAGEPEIERRCETCGRTLAFVEVSEA